MALIPDLSGKHDLGSRGEASDTTSPSGLNVQNLSKLHISSPDEDHEQKPVVVFILQVPKLMAPGLKTSSPKEPEEHMMSKLMHSTAS